MVEELSVDILMTLFHNAQNSIRTVIYDVLEQLMLDLVCEELIRELLKAHITKYIYADAGVAGFSKRLLTARSFMAPIAIFVKRKTVTSMNEKKCSAAVARKEPRDTIPTFTEDSQSSPSWADSLDGQVPSKRSSKRRLKHHHSKRRNKEVNRHSSSSKMSKEKYKTRLETESEEEHQSGHERHVQLRRAQESGMDPDSSVDRHEQSRLTCKKSSW